MARAMKWAVGLVAAIALAAWGDLASANLPGSAVTSSKSSINEITSKIAESSNAASLGCLSYAGQFDSIGTVFELGEPNENQHVSSATGRTLSVGLGYHTEKLSPPAVSRDTAYCGPRCVASLAG